MRETGPIRGSRPRRGTIPPGPRLNGRRGLDVAVIGAGVSGLVAAHLLSEDHRVTVFEANDYAGGHTNTVPVELDGRRYAVDTGFIVYNELNYPNFARLLEQLDVTSQPTTMSFSVRCDRTGIEYNGTNLNTLFAQRRNLLRPAFLAMVRDILRFNREAADLVRSIGDEVTVGEFVTERGYGEAFVRNYLVPMGAALWSSPPQAFRRFPIRFVVEFFENHRMLGVSGRPQWRVIRGGSWQYVRRLVRRFEDRLRLRTPVRAVRRTASGVQVGLDGGTETFDHVVFACHSDQALDLLEDPSDVERDLLGVFPYQENVAVLHTDDTLLPRSRRAWASWNYRLREDDPDRVTVTYNMNILQGLETPHVFCVTLNEEDRIDPGQVLRRITYRHPVYTSRRSEAQARHHELINVNRTSYCGAYWGYGFHEDGVNSALAVAAAFAKRLEVP